MKQNSKSNNYKKNKSTYKKNYIRESKAEKTFSKGSYNPQESGRNNDFAWYNRNPELTATATAIPFSTALGSDMSIYRAPDASVGPTAEAGLRRLPGIMAFNVVPNPGISDSPNSYVNKAARDYYAFLTRTTGRAPSYTACDSYLMLLALDALYYMHAWGRRTYGALRMFSPTNRYLAEPMVKAMGMDYNSWVNAAQNVVWRLDEFALRIGRYPMPKDIFLTYRHMWTFSNVFLDDASPKAQIYLARPDGYYRYEETGTESNPAGYLSWHALNENLSFEQYCTVMEDMLTSLEQSEDISIIRADMLKAFGEDPSKYFKAVATPVDYTIDFTRDVNALRMIHNATIHGYRPEESSTLNILQDPDTNSILYQPLVLSGLSARFKSYLDLDSANPTSEEIMEGSRWTTVLQHDEGDTVFIRACGAEWVSQMMIYTLNDYGDNSVARLFTSSNMEVNEVDTPTVTSVLLGINQITKFDWHPLINVWVRNSVDNTTDYCEYAGDVYNFTVVEEYQMMSLHDTAIISMLFVPR